MTGRLAYANIATALKLLTQVGRLVIHWARNVFFTLLTLLRIEFVCNLYWHPAHRLVTIFHEPRPGRMCSWGHIPGGNHVLVHEVLDEPERLDLAAAAIHGGQGSDERPGLRSGAPCADFVPKGTWVVAQVADDVLLENRDTVNVDRLLPFFPHFESQCVAGFRHEYGTSNGFMGAAYILMLKVVRLRKQAC